MPGDSLNDWAITARHRAPRRPPADHRWGHLRRRFMDRAAVTPFRRSLISVGRLIKARNRCGCSGGCIEYTKSAHIGFDQPITVKSCGYQKRAGCTGKQSSLS